MLFTPAVSIHTLGMYYVVHTSSVDTYSWHVLCCSHQQCRYILLACIMLFTPAASIHTLGATFVNAFCFPQLIIPPSDLFKRFNLKSIKLLCNRTNLRPHRPKWKSSMLNITYKNRRTNIWVKERTKLMNIISNVRKMKWSCAGHINRLKDDRWTLLLTCLETMTRKDNDIILITRIPI